MNQSVHSPLSSAWHNWLLENLQRGCSHASLLESMLKNNFSHEAASAHIAAMAADLAQNKSVSSIKPAAYQYDNSRIAPGNAITLADRQVQIAFRLTQPDVVLFDNFMTAAECEHLMALSAAKLLRSGVVDPDTGKTVIIEARSSEGCYFQRGENDFIAQLEQRIAALIQQPLEHGEGIQTLRYSAGGEYRPHFDYFPPEQTGSASHLTTGGQRTSTLIMYLNTVEQGGETIFPDKHLSICPKQGSALYFSYLNSQQQLDPATLHGGTPVIRGEKWIATKWMRERKY